MRKVPQSRRSDEGRGAADRPSLFSRIGILPGSRAGPGEWLQVKGSIIAVVALGLLFSPAAAAEFGTLSVRYKHSDHGWVAELAYSSPGPPVRLTVHGTLDGQPVDVDTIVTGKRVVDTVPLGEHVLDGLVKDLSANLGSKGNVYTLRVSSPTRAYMSASLVDWTKLKFKDGRTLSQDVEVTEDGKLLKPRTFTLDGGNVTLVSYDLTGFREVNKELTVTYTESYSRKPGKVHVFWYVPLQGDPLSGTNLDAEATVNVPFTLKGHTISFVAPKGAHYDVRYVGEDGLHDIQGVSKGGTVTVDLPSGVPASVVVTARPRIVSALEWKQVLVPGGYDNGLHVSWKTDDTGAAVKLEGKAKGAVLGIVTRGQVTRVVGGTIVDSGELPGSGLPYVIVKTSAIDGATTVDVYSTGPVVDVLAEEVE